MSLGAAFDEPLEVILVEDHLALRKGLELLLQEEGIRVAGVASGLAEARQLLARRRHDVVLLDLRLADGDGLELIRECELHDLGCNFVIYTGDTSRDRLEAAARGGARGFVLKTASCAALIAAVQRVAEGGVYVDPALTGLLSQSRSGRTARLSRREREILGLLADGLNGEQIADRLLIAPETVRTHVRNAMSKLGAHTRTHAVALAIAASDG